MPSEKRARQRAGRDARRAALAKQQKRQRLVRRSIVIAVVVVVVVGSVYLATRSSKSTPKPSAQATANAVAVKAGCPANPKTRVNDLTWSSAPAMTINTADKYTATVKTTVGKFVIALDAKGAPKSVNNFVFLSNKGYYRCVIFHRVVPGFVDQTGDPTGKGTGTPGYEFSEPGPAVASPQYPLGSVAMANSNNPATTDPTTNGGQWFVVAGSQGESLPPDYTLFGQVTSGMKVIDKINKDGNSNTADNGVPPKVIQRILSVKITTSPS